MANNNTGKGVAGKLCHHKFTKERKVVDEPRVAWLTCAAWVCAGAIARSEQDVTVAPWIRATCINSCPASCRTGALWGWNSGKSKWAEQCLRQTWGGGVGSQRRGCGGCL